MNLRAWADLYGEWDAGNESNICPCCEHELSKGNCVNVNCKETDIAYYCEYCKSGFLEDETFAVDEETLGLICPNCGDVTIKSLGEYGKQEL